MLSSLLLLVSLISVSEARVGFPFSEVLQADDLTLLGYSNFDCNAGCTIYVDVKSTDLVVTKGGATVATFEDILAVSNLFPKGLVLEAGNYRLTNRGASPSIDFVFYVVRAGAVNTDTLVAVPQKTLGILSNGPARYVTFLTSADAMEFSSITGTYPKGFPQIYTVGFDAVADTQCKPVYTARSQNNAEESWPVIRAPLLTVDFGFVGVHNITAAQGKGTKQRTHAGASTVYTSPGYVGCSYNRGQAYRSKVTTVEDQITLQSTSLYVEASAWLEGKDEMLHLSVNNQNLDLYGSDTKTVGFGYAAKFEVELGWTRQAAGSNWVVQLDFGTVPDQATSQAPPLQPTTSASSGIFCVASMIALAAAHLVRR